MPSLQWRRLWWLLWGIAAAVGYVSATIMTPGEAILSAIVGVLPRHSSTAEHAGSAAATFLDHGFQRLALHSKGEMQLLTGIFATDLMPELLQHGRTAYAPPPTELCSTPMTDDDLRLVKRVRGDDGEWWGGQYNRQNPEYDGELTPELALKLFTKHRFSIVANRMNWRWPPIAYVADSLEAALGHRVNANLYITPAGSQGFEAHFDWMEVIVLQLAGEKSWSIYKPLVDLPREDQKYKPTIEELGKPTAEYAMKPGDVLHLPSGTPHEARAWSNDLSVHVTFGLEIDEAFTWEGLLHHALDNFERDQLGGHRERDTAMLLHAAIRVAASGENAELRRALPTRWFREVEAAAVEAAGQFDELLEGAIEGIGQRLEEIVGENGEGGPGVKAMVDPNPAETLAKMAHLLFASGTPLITPAPERKMANLRSLCDTHAARFIKQASVLDAIRSLGREFDSKRAKWQKEAKLCLRNHMQWHGMEPAPPTHAHSEL